MKSSSALVVGVLLLLAVPAWAQSTPSLTDLAKQAQEKKPAPPAKKTFTNDDLKSVTVPPSDDAKSDDPKADAKSGDPKAADAKPDGKAADAAKADDAKKDDPTKTEKYWHDRMAGAREDLRRNQAFADALQSRINGLTADFAARDDPYQRAQIADDRQKALAELDRVHKAIEDGNKAITQIEDDARKAMVPAGWIR